METPKIDLQKISVNDIKGYFSEKYLNPLKCNLSFMNCNMFIYFMIGIIIIFSIFLLFHANKYSGFNLFLSTMCMGMIFAVCSLLLLNICITNSSVIYSYMTLTIGTLLILMLTVFIKKK